MHRNRVLHRLEAANLDLSSRIRLEAQLMDTVLKQETPKIIPRDWRFEDFCNQFTWRAYLFDFLGPLDGLTVLDLGCEYRPTSIYFALAGAKHVFACDVSLSALRFLQRTAAIAGLANKVTPILCAGERVSIAIGKIDIVYGAGVLHHLQLDKAAVEIARVLKKNGKAGFKDPLGQNPLLELVRDYMPYRWKHAAKGTDCPLRFKDIEKFGQYFSSCTYKGFSLIGMIAAFIWGRGKSVPRKIADTLDNYVLSVFPFLHKYCRFVITCIVKSMIFCMVLDSEIEFCVP